MRFKYIVKITHNESNFYLLEIKGQHDNIKNN